MKIEWPKPQFWILGFIVWLSLSMVIVGPQNEYAWLEYAISEGAGYMLGYIIGLALQIAIASFACEWLWNAYKKSKEE